MICRGKKRWFISVSYTHLDVYKRQIDEGLVQLVLTSADAPQLEEFLGEHITLFYQPARQWKAAEISILGSKADGYVVLYSAKEE